MSNTNNKLSAMARSALATNVSQSVKRSNQDINSSLRSMNQVKGVDVVGNDQLDTLILATENI